MFAVISYNNDQYKVEEGREYKIKSKDLGDAKTITFDKVLILEDGSDVKIGTPTLEGVSVEAEIVGPTTAPKVTGTKFKPKKHYQRNLGHKQDLLIVKILTIKK
ncbi:MAG: 50S ribosomal protein L21 [Candidatus Berkelbacteria bacterium]|nr:50S ribosomal protein L21 [Candidatus Berkelbacteria bacterium]